VLALERTFPTVAGLALFGDHADPSLVYYLPTAPTLARTDGVPELSLLSYRRDLATLGEDDPIGGGFLSFTVELRATERQLRLATEALQEEGVISPRLMPLPVRAGKAVLATMGRRSEPDAEGGERFVLFEETRGEVTPSLYGSQRALFGLVMPSHEAAAIMKALVLGEGTTPLGVRYELEYLGLRPAVHARVTADYRRINDEVSTKFDFGFSYYGYGLELKIEDMVRDLIEEGALSVEVTYFTDDADFQARVDEALKWVQQRLVQDFFRPSLPPNDPRQALMDTIATVAQALGAGLVQDLLLDDKMLGAAAKQVGISPQDLRTFLESGGEKIPIGNGYFSFSLNFTRTHLKETLHKTLVFDYTAAAAEERIAAPQGLLSFITQGVDLAPLVHNVAADDPYFDHLDVMVRVVDDLAALGVTRVIVHLAWPGMSEPGAETLSTTVSFHPDDLVSKRFGTFLDGVKDLSYRYRVEVHLVEGGPWPGESLVELGPWTTTRSRELIVRPLEHVRRLDLSVVTGTLRFEEAPNVLVALRHGGLSTTLTLSAEAPRGSWSIRCSPGVPVQAQLTWTTPERTQVQGAWFEVEGNLLTVPGPWRSRRTLALVPLLPADVQSATVIVGVAEEGNHSAQTVSFSPGDVRPQRVVLPSLSSPPAPATVHVMVVGADFSFVEVGPLQTEESVFLVRASEVPQRRLVVRLLGTDLGAAGVSAVRVRLTDPSDPTRTAADTTFTASQQQPVTVLVPEVAGALRYGVEVTRFDRTGGAHPSPWELREDAQLLVSALIPQG
jgi:hypothetical protein